MGEQKREMSRAGQGSRATSSSRSCELRLPSTRVSTRVGPEDRIHASMNTRRAFFKTAGATTALASLGNLGFLRSLPAVSAAEAALPPEMVRFDPAVEPLVRLLEDTPRDRILEEVGNRLRRGLTYRELLAALLLAGVRNLQPRPVGFKFHAVLVVNSAHLASLASTDSDRWLPIFWAIDYFKDSQAADVREGDWTMGAANEDRLPPAHRAREVFIEAMDHWDEAAADAAITRLARSASRNELFDLFCHYGIRDFRDIGHKAIYVANGFRALEVIGWQHAEPVLRSLAYALLERGGAPGRPSELDLPADRPFRENQERLGRIRREWLDGDRDGNATAGIVRDLRTANPSEISEQVVALLNRGVAPAAVYDGLFAGAGEMLMRAPGIRSLHAVTFTNAAHYAWTRCSDESTRRALLLQNAAFLPLFRGDTRDGVQIDTFEPELPKAGGEGALEEIFATVHSDPLAASRKMLAWLQVHPDSTALGHAARRLIFLKGRNTHDYKFSSAVLEDYERLASPWKERFLASSTFNLRGTTETDNPLVARARAALAA